MRKALGILSILTASLTQAQTQFDYLGGLPISANASGCLFLDLNTYGTNTGENDVKFVHGNGEIYFDAIHADSCYMPQLTGKGGVSINGKYKWGDCDQEVNVFSRSRVYIISDVSSLSLGTHVLPFKYVNRYNYVVVNVVSSDSIRVRGWKFNMTLEEYECFSLDDLKINDDNFKDFDSMGNPVKEDHTGLMFRVYEDGRRKTFYK